MSKTYLLLVLTCLGFGALAAHAQSANKPKRVKVRPVFTEGIRVEGSVIFTYVDEKRRRRLSLDLYKPAKQDGPLPAIVIVSPSHGAQIANRSWPPTPARAS